MVISSSYLSIKERTSISPVRFAASPRAPCSDWLPLWPRPRGGVRKRPRLSRAAAAAASGAPGPPWPRGRRGLSRPSRRRRWAACPEELAPSAPWKKQKPPARSVWPAGGCAPSRRRRRGAGTSATPHRPVRPRPRGGIPDPSYSPGRLGVFPPPRGGCPASLGASRGPRAVPEAPGRDEPGRLVRAVRRVQRSAGRLGVHPLPRPRGSASLSRGCRVPLAPSLRLP